MSFPWEGGGGGQQWCGWDYSGQFSAEVNNEWCYTSAAMICLHVLHNFYTVAYRSIQRLFRHRILLSYKCCALICTGEHVSSLLSLYHQIWYHMTVLFSQEYKVFSIWCHRHKLQGVEVQFILKKYNAQLCYRPTSTWTTTPGPSPTRTPTETTTWNGEYRPCSAECMVIILQSDLYRTKTMLALHHEWMNTVWYVDRTHVFFFIVNKLTLCDVLEVSTVLHQTCLCAALHFMSACLCCAVSLSHLILNALSLHLLCGVCYRIARSLG